MATVGGAPLTGGVSTTGGALTSSGVGGVLGGVANTVGNALGGMYVDVSIPLGGGTPQYAPTSTPIYYGGATTNTANTATTNNQTNTNAYATTNNNTVNNTTSGIGGVRYGTYSYTPPDPLQPKPLLGGLQAEGRAIAPNGVQLSDPGQGDINIARNYGGPVTGTLPAPSASDPRVPLVQGRNTANAVTGSDQGYYASPGNVGQPSQGVYPQGPQGIDPRVLQAYQNAQGVQNLYNIQQGMNPNLQQARNMQAMAQMMALQRMRGQQMPPAPQMLGNGPGWRNAMYRAAGGLNRNIAARNINAYNQQNANWREQYAQQQMNDRDAFGHFAILAGQQMSAEQQIYNTGLSQAVELTKAAQQGATPAQIQEMMKYIVDNTTDPKSRQTMLNGIGNGLLATGAWTPDQVKGLMSISDVYSDKAAEMSQGRQDRHVAAGKRLEMQDMRKQLLGLQIADKQFDNDHQAEKYALDAAAKKAQIDGMYRRQVQWAIKDARSVDDDYNGMMKEIKDVEKDPMIPKNQKPQIINEIKQRINQRFGETDDGGVPQLVSDARRSINEYGQVLGVPQKPSVAPGAMQPQTQPPAPRFVPPPQAQVPDLSKQPMATAPEPMLLPQSPKPGTPLTDINMARRFLMAAGWNGQGKPTKEQQSSAAYAAQQMGWGTPGGSNAAPKKPASR